MGAIDEAVASLDELGDADVAIASVSVDALPGAVRDLCDRLPGAVVTDVGSTKQALVEAVDREHFIGGHPLAGAETTGVAHAREDLFDGATWYLTPGERTPGVLYERLARFVAGLGAVPTAIAPGRPRPPDGRRLAPAARRREPARRAGGRGAGRRDAAGDGPVVSRRDARRGREPGAVGADLPREPRRARGADRRSRARGWGRCARCSTATATSRAWQAAGRGASAPRCSRSGCSAARRARSASSVPNKPGVVALDRARAGARGHQHHGHVARARGRQPHRRSSRCGCARRTPSARSSSSPSSATRRHERRLLRARRAAARRGHRAAGQVDLPPRGAVRRDVERDGADRELPARRGHDVDARRRARARRRGVDASGGRGRRARRRPRRRARARRAPIDVGNAGTLMRLLPGWLAAQEGRTFALDGDASIRRRPVDRIAEPLARMGAVIEADGRPLPAVRRARHGAARRSPTSCRSRARR